MTDDGAFPASMPFVWALDEDPPASLISSGVFAFEALLTSVILLSEAKDESCMFELLFAMTIMHKRVRGHALDFPLTFKSSESVWILKPARRYTQSWRRGLSCTYIEFEP